MAILLCGEPAYVLRPSWEESQLRRLSWLASCTCLLGRALLGEIAEPTEESRPAILEATRCKRGAILSDELIVGEFASSKQLSKG